MPGTIWIPSYTIYRVTYHNPIKRHLPCIVRCVTGIFKVRSLTTTFISFAPIYKNIYIYMRVSVCVCVVCACILFWSTCLPFSEHHRSVLGCTCHCPMCMHHCTCTWRCTRTKLGEHVFTFLFKFGLHIQHCNPLLRYFFILICILHLYFEWCIFN